MLELRLVVSVQVTIFVLKIWRLRRLRACSDLVAHRRLNLQSHDHSRSYSHGRLSTILFICGNWDCIHTSTLCGLLRPGSAGGSVPVNRARCESAFKTIEAESRSPSLAAGRKLFK